MNCVDQNSWTVQRSRDTCIMNTNINQVEYCTSSTGKNITCRGMREREKKEMEVSI